MFLVIICMLNASLSAGLYIKFHVVSSTVTAGVFASAWNLSSVVLCLVLDARNRRTFLSSRQNVVVLGSSGGLSRRLPGRVKSHQPAQSR